MKTYTSESIAETEQIARELAKTLHSGDFIALTGTLGAGKTAFVRGLVSFLAPELVTKVHSPTFTVVNEYRGNKNEIYHFDFYRLKSEEDLYSCGFYDYFEREGIIVSEWAEMFSEAIPPDAIKIQFECEPTGKRIITINQ